MQPVTFICLHCNNLMGVGAELMGQQVRCPTCGQIVQAPLALSADHIPEIQVPGPTETPESIFGDDHEEDLFASPAPQPTLPFEPAAPAEGVVGTGFAPYPPPASMAGDPPAVLPEFTSTPPVFEVSTGPLPDDEVAGGALAPAWDVAHEAPVANDPAALFADAPVGEQIAINASGAAQAGSVERKKQSLTAIIFLVPYALISTLLAGWFGYQYYTLRAKHPLENIPDIIGDNDPAKRNPLKQTSERTVTLPAPDQPLPDKLKVALGASLRVGDLEIKPLRIEEGRFQFTTIFENGTSETKKTEHPALMLQVRFKNTSTDVVFHPTDPFFERQYIPDQHRSKPYMFLEVGAERFYGGPFNYLGFRRDAKNPRKRVFAAGQENDAAPLQPGDERETRFYTFPDSEGRLLAAVHGFSETLVWRLQVRRGLMNFKDRAYSMCAVVGVQFRAADVHHVN